MFRHEQLADQFAHGVVGGFHGALPAGPIFLGAAQGAPKEIEVQVSEFIGQVRGGAIDGLVGEIGFPVFQAGLFHGAAKCCQEVRLVNDEIFF